MLIYNLVFMFSRMAHSWFCDDDFCIYNRHVPKKSSGSGIKKDTTGREWEYFYDEN